MLARSSVRRSSGSTAASVSRRASQARTSGRSEKVVPPSPAMRATVAPGAPRGHPPRWRCAPVTVDLRAGAG